ncbi:MAG: glycosyl transferase [Ruminococcaceae bacterium]|nr:glycosyl transferase [Oscillospiraceae bacterium]
MILIQKIRNRYYWLLRKIKKYRDLAYYKYAGDKAYIRKRYREEFGEKLNLKDPVTFNEKLQWLKLYDRNPLYTQLVDKYRVREYIAQKLGEEYLIPLLWVGDDPDDIDFDTLPDQFVLKCNHNSGKGMCICRDKSTLNYTEVRNELRKGLQENFYLNSREWPYKNVHRKIICEQYMKDGSGTEGLTDYKFFCFNGAAKIMYISNDFSKEPRTDFFDMDFNHLSIRIKDPPADIAPQKPEHFEKMKQFAEILSKDIPHLRVDFYLIKGKIYVGELTFYHSAGFARITPDEWNLQMGEWIKLPKKRKH